MTPAGNLPIPSEARLGKLVQLPKRGRSAKPAAHEQGKHEPAEVILFTGVRYERNDTPGLPNKPAGAASGKRRRG
jgi:hypothetical protein